MIKINKLTYSRAMYKVFISSLGKFTIYKIIVAKNLQKLQSSIATCTDNFMLGS